MRRFLVLILTALLLLLSISTFQVTDAQNVFICRPGETYVMTGRGPPLTAVLLLFDGTPVGGDTTDGAGNYRVKLAVGPEAPGDYQIEVQVRASRQVLATSLCRVPGPDSPDGPDAAAQPEASATATTRATTAATATVGATTRAATTGATNTVAPTSSPGGPTFTASPTASPSVSPSATATNQGGVTSTPSATGQRATTVPPSATATRSPTGSTSTDVEFEIDVEEDDPTIGNMLLVFGDVTDTNGNGIPNVAVAVAFSYSGGTGIWCNATTDEDGYWECEGNVTAAMRDKTVTLTGQITINGRTLKQEAIITPVEEAT